jgi:hypothetical protein
VNCAYCITNQFHLLVIQKADGTFHVHAPFQDKKMMKRIKLEIEKAEKNQKETK